MKHDLSNSLNTARALKEGLKLVAHGYQLTPTIITRGKDGEKRAKFPIGWATDESWSSDPDQIRDWSVQFGCSFALRTGAKGGVDVVDLDVKEGKNGLIWWSSQGYPMGSMVVDTPSGGLHLYVPACGLPTVANVVAPGVDTRGNGGLVFAPGAYIIGEEDCYRVQGPMVRVRDLQALPEDLVAKIIAAHGPQKNHAADGRITTHDREWMLDRTKKAVDKLASSARPDPDDKIAGRDFRLEQMGVAMMLGRIVDAGLTDIETAREIIEEATLKVWPEGLSDKDRKNIESGLVDGPSKERWRERDTSTPFDPADESSDEVESAYEKELKRQRIQRQVRAELDAEARDPLWVLGASEYLSAPPPDYLVPKMLYRDGLAVVFGPPGAAKSFLVLDVALSLATGTKWCGHPLGRGKVHYVMAEGQATNVLRTLAWLTHRKVDPKELDDWFTAIPVPIMLTEPGVVDYLPIVEKDQPDLIILDTKNLMFAGKESQGDDYGLMLRTLHKIRQTAGGAAVVLIDHTGLNDETRTRGSNAQKGGVETEIAVADQGGVRLAKVMRDKSGEVGQEWVYRLEQIQSVKRPAGVSAPAVCVYVDPSDIIQSPFSDKFEDWNDPNQPSLPLDVIGYSGAGKSAVNAVARFMRYSTLGKEMGFSLAGCRSAVKKVYVDDKGKPKWSDDTIDRGWSALVELDRLVPAGMGDLASRSLWQVKSEDPE